MSHYQYYPLASWKDFERLCKDLFAEHWNTNVISIYGREGCIQNGVDIYGQLNNKQGIYGIQCKSKDIYPEKSLSRSEIEIEINKAKKFIPELSHYIIATTARKDPKTQSVLLELVKELEPSFSVEIMFWDDISDLIDKYQSVKDVYYPSSNATKRLKLFERANINNRINTVNVYFDESEDVYILNCPYYYLYSVVSKDIVWLELGRRNGCAFDVPKSAKSIKTTEIDARKLSDLVEKYFFAVQVDIFDVYFDLTKESGFVAMGNSNLINKELCYVKDGKVYTEETDVELDKYKSDAYLCIREYMLELASLII